MYNYLQTQRNNIILIAFANLGQNVVAGPDVHIGSGCKNQNNVSLYKGVTLEDDVFCGPSMVFTNVFNLRSHIRRMDEMADTLKSIRVHGKGKDKYDNIRLGINGRLDTLQAAILLPKLDIFPP